MPRRKTTEQFIAEATAVHGDAYDYSNTQYVRSTEKLSVRCRQCSSDFSVWPGHHLAGQGCSFCWPLRRKGKRKKRTTETFIEAARQAHGDKFDYSKVEYKNSQTKVTIGCATCGLVFEQLANSHLRGTGCPHCSAMRGGRKRARAFAALFEQRAREVHGDAYGYEQVVYHSNRKPVILYCRACYDVFEQAPDNHLAGKGCSKCGLMKRARTRTKSTLQFIDEALKVYGPGVFSYEDTEYVSAHQHVTIRCTACERSFNRTPASHLQKHECPFCCMGNSVSKAETAWLDSLNVPERQYRVTLPSGRTTRVDGYDPASNTVYAFLGSFWHADPRRCPPEEEHPVIGRLNEHIYRETLERLETLRAAGFVVVSVWEEDWGARHLQ